MSKNSRRKAEFSEEYFDPGTGEYVVVSGSIVERDALAIAEKIQEYDENLVLMCLDDPLADYRDAPFVLCERQPNGTLHRVFEAWKLDDRILERIFAADKKRFDPLQRIEKMEADQRRYREAQFEEKMQRDLDILVTGVKRRQSTYTIENPETGDMVRIHEDKPPTRVSSESKVIPL